MLKINVINTMRTWISDLMNGFSIVNDMHLKDLHLKDLHAYRLQVKL